MFKNKHGEKQPLMIQAKPSEPRTFCACFSQDAHHSCFSINCLRLVSQDDHGLPEVMKLTFIFVILVIDRRRSRAFDESIKMNKKLYRLRLFFIITIILYIYYYCTDN